MNVALYPAECGDLIHVTVIVEKTAGTFVGESRKSEEPESSKAIIEADKDHSMRTKVAAVRDGRRATPIDQASPVDIHHHRKFFAGRTGRRQHVEIKTVFTDTSWRRPGNKPLE